MNLTKLFEAQKALDERIIEEKGLQGQNLIPKKVLALITELGECANEWRGFKFWSEDQEPRTEVRSQCESCLGTGVVLVPEGWINCYCASIGPDYKNPLLEEYVDCLHFALSLVLDTSEWLLRHLKDIDWTPLKSKTVDEQFIAIAYSASNIQIRDGSFMNAGSTLQGVLGLGEMLGFTSEQIESAYFAKNKTNHKRQEEHY